MGTDMSSIKKHKRSLNREFGKVTPFLSGKNVIHLVGKGTVTFILCLGIRVFIC